jgi:hypothetical protein
VQPAGAVRVPRKYRVQGSNGFEVVYALQLRMRKIRRTQGIYRHVVGDAVSTQEPKERIRWKDDLGRLWRDVARVCRDGAR